MLAEAVRKETRQLQIDKGAAARRAASLEAKSYLVRAYILSIAVVHGSRYIKRFYARRFANNVNRRMKIPYNTVVAADFADLEGLSWLVLRNDKKFLGK